MGREGAVEDGTQVVSCALTAQEDAGRELMRDERGRLGEPGCADTTRPHKRRGRQSPPADHPGPAAHGLHALPGLVGGLRMNTFRREAGHSQIALSLLNPGLPTLCRRGSSAGASDPIAAQYGSQLACNCCQRASRKAITMTPRPGKSGASARCEACACSCAAVP
jgi:hypothetical protein